MDTNTAADCAISAACGAVVGAYAGAYVAHRVTREMVNQNRPEIVIADESVLESIE